MKATLDFIQQKFAEFNQLIFNGELPPPTFLPSRARTYLGRYECNIRHHLFSKAERYNHRIRFSTTYDLPAEELEDVLIHEMIHYYISFRGIKDTAPHGTIFQTLMGTINLNHQRHITISRGLSSEVYATDRPLAMRFFCVMTLPDGSRAFVPVTKQSMFTLWTRLPQSFSATAATWYVSHDPFWAGFRRLSAARRIPTRLRCYPIDTDTLEHHLKGAKVLEKNGDTIEVKGQP